MRVCYAMLSMAGDVMCWLPCLPALLQCAKHSSFCDFVLSIRACLVMSSVVSACLCTALACNADLALCSVALPPPRQEYKTTQQLTVALPGMAQSSTGAVPARNNAKWRRD